MITFEENKLKQKIKIFLVKIIKLFFYIKYFKNCFIQFRFILSFFLVFRFSFQNK